MTDDGYLTGIDETKEIGRGADGMITGAGGKVIPEGTVVSMNFWGFTGAMMEEMVAGFPAFLDAAMKNDPMKAEYLLPIYIDELLHAGKVSVKVLPTHDKWFGVTYAEDKQIVIDSFAKLVAEGVYRKDLFSDLKK